MMPEDAPLIQPEMAEYWPRMRPFGGSKWARFFAGPARAARVVHHASLHENAVLMPDGRLAGAEMPVLKTSEENVFAVAAGPQMPLGLFLSAVLPALHRHVPASFGYRLAGPQPAAAQWEILDRLGWGGRYITVTTPQRFAKILLTGTALDVVTYAPLMSRLRAGPGALTGAVAILPDHTGQRFSLRNRASLVGWLRARHIPQLNPAALTFDSLAAALAGAKLVLLADPAQAGLLGLCHPGAMVLEIAPEGWVGSTTRAIAEGVGLNWQIFLGSAPTYPVTAPAAFGAMGAMGYDVAIGALGRALAAL
jgi:hypothetical protein